MSKMAWERAAGSAAKLATVSVFEALAATTSVSAEEAKAQTATPKVPASYGQTFAQPSYGQPQFAAPAQFGAHAQFGAPAPYGAPAQFGQQPAWGQPLPGQAAYGAPQMPRQMIAPATTATYAPAGAPAPHGQLPAHAQLPAHGQRPIHGQMPAHPQFGQRLPIFANTQANGITYGPPSYTKPKDFDPKMASASPFPSAWGQQSWGQAPGRAPMPSLAGAPVYGGQHGQQMMPATMGQYAPAEPTYAPAEPLRPNYSAVPAAPAPAYQTVDVTPAEAAPIQAQVQPASSYSYQMAPETAAAPAYVGQSTDLGAYAPAATTAANPYEVVIGSANSGAATTYSAAPAYEAAPAPAYEAAPAYQSASGYEMTTEAAPQYQATTYGGTSYETVTTAAPAYEAAPAYQAAPAYEAAPQYQAAIAAPAYGTTSSSFSSGSNHFVQVGAFRNPARAERLVRKLQGASEQPIVTQATVRGKLYYRVRVPAMDKRDAAAVQNRIRGLGYYEARMVRG